MAAFNATNIIELGLIELKYASADSFLEAEGQPLDTTTRSVALYFQAAHHALEVCLQIIVLAEARKRAIPPID